MSDFWPIAVQIDAIRLGLLKEKIYAGRDGSCQLDNGLVTKAML